MCGIIGYTGKSEASGILLKGLKVLEYRGYDSAGVALENDIVKTAGRVEDLRKLIDDNNKSTTGIGHTRWATHGQVNSLNAHPHHFGKVTLVHNGIIENYKELAKKYCIENELISQTDTEVAAAVINSYYDGDAVSAIANASQEFKGTYALAVMFDDVANTIFAIRNVSPIVICQNKNGIYLASDILAIGEYNKNYFVLPELCIAKLHSDKVEVFDRKNNTVSPKSKTVDWDINAADKGGYPFFLEKEIMEQPDAIAKTINSRIINGLPDFSADNIEDEFFVSFKSIAIVACGTAMHAGMVAKKLIEKRVKIPCEVHMASEFIYSDAVLNKDVLFLCISQSGETVDTLEALKFAKKNGCKSLSIINVKGSSIARESDYVIYTQAGAEISVASTKAYTTQLSVMFLLTAKLALENKTMSKSDVMNYIAQVKEIPNAIKSVLQKKKDIHLLAKQLLECEHAFMIGRGFDHIALLEASLKLKEISYIHCEAFASGELKHGTIALITKDTPIIALITQEKLKSKEISNIKEVQSRGANVITLIRQSLTDEHIHCDLVLPDTNEDFAVATSVVAMQLLAYYVSSDKGLDVDKPRNLAKVVTVE